MRSIILLLLVVVLFATSCSRYISIHDAAKGNTKCSKRHGVY
jgi:hypothetical protein